MSDLGPFLDREAHRIRAEGDPLGAMLHRAARRRLVRRVATGAVALAVAGTSLGLAFAAFYPDDRARPAAPVPGPSASPTPGADWGLVVANGSSNKTAAQFAAALLAGEAVVPDIVVLTRPASARTVTTIHCHPAQEAEAVELRDEFFPGAELRPRIDPDTILVTVGDDFVGDNPSMFDHYLMVRRFMERRTEGQGAEGLLSERAARDYGEGVGGLSLYSYAEGERYQITSIFGTGDETSIATVHIVGRRGTTVESITVGDAEPADGRLEIIAAAM
jgi:hypothetical protein